MRKSLQLKQFDSVNGIIHVESDIDNTFKTAQFIRGDVRIRYRKGPETMDDVNVRDWYAHGDPEYEMQPNQGEVFAHVARDLDAPNVGDVHQKTVKCLKLSLNYINMSAGYSL